MAVYKDDNKTKDGRSWYFKTYKKDFDGNNKAYKSKRYETKKEAQEAERLFLMKRDNPLRKKFIDIANNYFIELKRQKKDETIYSYIMDYKKHIKPFFENNYINDITVLSINEWKNLLEKKTYKITYLNKLYSILNNIFKFAIKEYGLNNNPVISSGRFVEKNNKIVPDEEKIRYITLNEFNTFIEHVENITYKRFFYFAYYTGCRKGEIQALTWKDINFDNKEIAINKTLCVKNKDKKNNTKNYLNRKIKMNQLIYDMLKLHKNEMMKYTDFKETWYVFGNGMYLPKTNLDREKDNAFKKSGVHRITMHEFRHSHVSLLINEYVKVSKEKNMKVDATKFLLMMANRMGHSLDVMQKTYMHLFPTIQDEIIDLLDNL